MEGALAANGTATLASTECSLCCTDLIGGLAVCAASPPSEWFAERHAELSTMAGMSGERAAGTRIGISIKDNGAHYLSPGAVIGICFQLLCQTQSKSTNMK